MKTVVAATPLRDLVLVTIDYFRDERGFFIEPWNKRDFASAGLDLDFVQEGHSSSTKGVLRGLHYQDTNAPMGKLVRCTVGSVFDVAVDMRMSSATCGRWFGVVLSADQKNQIYVPPGFAHGFLTVSDLAEVQYKQTGFYSPQFEHALRWNDSDVAIDWPISDPILSEKDRNAPSFRQYLSAPKF